MTEPATGTRIERAVAVFLTWQEHGDGDAAALLAAHPDLAELLEPMLDEDDPAGPPAAGGDTGAERIGPYRLVRELGRGGMGVVYEAHQDSLDRRVALKVLGALWSTVPQTVARFRREASTVARLRHPHIVDVHEVGQDGDAHWFAMELVPGRPLDEVVRDCAARGVPPSQLCGADLLAAATPEGAAGTRPPLPDLLAAPWPRAVARVLLPVAEALAYAHTQGVLHRDVKPSNVLLRPDGTPLLADFGLAREEALPAMTRTGELAGTPHYVSPEQADGRPVDARTDVFSLGATLYELLTLRRAFDGQREGDVLQAIRQRDPLDPRRVDPALPTDLAAIAQRALEKAPARRYPNMDALATDLRSYLADRPVQARPLSTLARLGRHARRHPARALAAAALALLLLTIAGFAGWVIARQPELAAGRAELHAQELRRTIEGGYTANLLGERDAARRAFQAALELDRGNVYALTALIGGRLLPIDEAVALLDRHHRRGEPPHSLDRLRVILLHARGESAAAKELLATLPAPRTASDHFVAGYLALPRRHQARDAAAFETAVTHLHHAVLRSPQADFLHYQNLALAASRADDTAEARACAEATLVLWPDRADALLVAGVALTYVDADRALRLFERAVDLEPDRPVLQRNLATAHAARGDFAQARALLERIVAQVPGDATAWSLLSIQCVRLGDWQGAIDSGQRAAELEPSDARHLTSVAYSYEQLGDDDRARELYERCAELDPKWPRAHRNVIGIHFARGDEPAMLREFERWVAAVPDRPSAWRRLASHCLEPVLGATVRLERGRAAARRATGLEDGAVSWSLRALGAALAGEQQAARAALERAAPALDAVAGDTAERIASRLARVRELLGD